MGWSIPYGFKWGPDGTLVKDESGAGEFGQTAGGPSGAPNEINAPPQFLDDNENIYKDAGGVIRNLKQGRGGGVSPTDPRLYEPSPYSSYSPTQQMGPQPQAATGGRGQYSGMGGGNSGTWGSQYTNKMGGGQSGGQGGGGGGGGMALMQDTRMSSQLDPGLWNTPITGGNAQSSAGQAGGYASALANLNPGVAPSDRTLYDRYSGLLQGGMAGMANDPGVQFALSRAQQANQRQLNAGRMRNSGRALEEMAGVTTGNLMQQFGNLANIYSQGAGMEGQRYATDAGFQMDAQKLKLAGLQGAGDLAVRSGQLYTGADDAALRARALDLERSKANILTPNQSQAQTVYNTAVAQANQGGAYGSYSPSLSQQYLSLTGTPLTMSYTPGQAAASGSYFNTSPGTAGYWR